MPTSYTLSCSYMKQCHSGLRVIFSRVKIRCISSTGQNLNSFMTTNIIFSIEYSIYSATDTPTGKRSIVVSVSVSLCVYVCLFTIIASELNIRSSPRFFVHVTCGCGSVHLWRRSDTLCTSGIVDDVIFAHKPRLLDVAAQLERSAHASLGLAINCAQ